MTSADSNYINDLNNTIIYIYKYIAPVFFIIGNIGNLITVLIFLKKSWRKNVCVFYFQIYILSASLYINSIMIGSIFMNGYHIRMINSSVFLCKIYFYIAFLCSSICPTILILASIDRLLISSQNIDRRLYSSKRLAYFSISLSSCIWIVYNFHILIKVNLQEYYPSVFICYYDLSKLYHDFVIYSTMLISMASYIVMLALSIIAFKNVRYIRIVPRKQRNQICSMTKKDFQLLRCLFAEDIAYIICSLFYNVYNLYSIATQNYTQTTLQQTIGTFLDTLSVFIFNIPYCINFFIFIGISKAFRQELKRIIYKIYGKNLIILQEEQNRQENIEVDVVAVESKF